MTNKFEIVKHIVTTKVAETEANETKAIKRTQRQELDALIAAKKALQNYKDMFISID